MIKDNDRISPYQLAMIIITASIGIGIFSLPANIAIEAGVNGYILLPLAGLVNLVAVSIMIKLCNLFPQKTLPDITEIVLGKFLGKIVTFLITLIILNLITFSMRSFTDVLNIFILFKTPSWVVSLTFLLVCAYLVRGGVEAIARFHEVGFLMLFVPFLLVIILGYRNVAPNNLMPFMYNFTGDIGKYLGIVFFSLGGFEVILYYLAFVKRKNNMYKPVFLSVLFTTVFSTIVVIICTAKFGSELTGQLTWPLINYIRGVSQGRFFMESLDGILIWLWTLAVFTTVIINYYIVNLSVAKIFNIQEQKKLVIPVGILLYVLSLSVGNTKVLMESIKIIRPIQVIIIVYAVPILLLIVAKIRKLGGVPNEKED